MGSFTVTFEGAICQAFGSGVARALVINGLNPPGNVVPHIGKVKIPVTSVVGSPPAPLNATQDGTNWVIELKGYEILFTGDHGTVPTPPVDDNVPKLTKVLPSYGPLFSGWNSNAPDVNKVIGYMNLTAALTAKPNTCRAQFTPNDEGKPPRKLGATTMHGATAGSSMTLVLREYNGTSYSIPIEGSTVAIEVENHAQNGVGSDEDFRLQYTLAASGIDNGPIPHCVEQEGAAEDKSDRYMTGGGPGCTNTQYP